jgi:hypothetical protein
MTTSSNSLAEQLDEIRRRAEALARGLTPAQLTKRPHPGKWSIAECIAHLNVLRR